MAANNTNGQEPPVLAAASGRVLELVLNRPKALNALDVTMVRLLRRHYAVVSAAAAAAANSSSGGAAGGPACIVVRGAGGRAFCAGGDVKGNVLLARDGGAEGRKMAVEFFKEEYLMNAELGALRAPHIALWDGVVMGGGVGASLHGAFRVATERTVLAMPETGIGLFPDVGVMQALARLPGGAGAYLALTGARLAGREAKAAGLATHYVPSSRLADLTARLRALGGAAADLSAVARALDAAEAAAAAGDGGDDGGFAARRPLIDAIFAVPPASSGGGGSGNGSGGALSPGGEVARIIAALRAAALEGADDAWRRDTLGLLERASPLSLAVTWEYYRRARFSGMALAECLEQDFALVARCVAGEGDYWEGVRARLIDKDNAPRWRYARPEDVPDAAVAAMLAAPPGHRRLGLAGGGGGGARSRL